MNGIEIRPTSPTDLDALADVLVQVHAADGYPVEGVSNPRAWVQIPDTLGQWTALLRGRVVGHVALMEPTPDEVAAEMMTTYAKDDPRDVAVLARLFVSPDSRGAGIANALMEEAEACARHLQRHLVLEVLLKDKSAIALYVRRGWTRLGQVPHTYGENEAAAASAMGKTLISMS